MQENIQIYGWKRCIKLCLKIDSFCEVIGGGTLCGRGQPHAFLREGSLLPFPNLFCLLKISAVCLGQSCCFFSWFLYKSEPKWCVARAVPASNLPNPHFLPLTEQRELGSLPLPCHRGHLPCSLAQLDVSGQKWCYRSLQGSAVLSVLLCARNNNALDSSGTIFLARLSPGS